MSFKDLKAKSGSFEKLQTELNKINTPTAGNFEDARLWKPDLDKTGNGYAIYPNPPMKICHGSVFGAMPLVGRVDGTLRTV